jgi:hypothetical protein
LDPLSGNGGAAQQLNLPAPGSHALPVTRQPCLKVVLAVRQPAALTPHVPSRRLNSRGSSRKGIRHGRLTNQHWRLLTCGLRVSGWTHGASITARDARTLFRLTMRWRPPWHSAA